MCYDCADEDALHDAREELNAPKQPTEHVYIYGCKFDEVPANGSRGKVVVTEHTEIALFNLKGKIYAISNICPHERSPLLSEGYVDKEEMSIACPLHGWTYSIIDGKSVVGNGNIPTYDIKIIDGEIWIEEPMEDHSAGSIEWADLPGDVS